MGIDFCASVMRSWVFLVFFSILWASGESKTFKATVKVTAKNKVFTCKYTIVYTGNVFVNKAKSKAICKPNFGNFGSVTVEFVIKGKTVIVTHVIKKGKDTITNVKVEEITTTTTTTTTTSSATTTNGTGGGSGSGTGSGGGGSGSGSGNETESIGGESMQCSCSMPLFSEDYNRRLATALEISEGGLKVSPKSLDRSLITSENVLPLLLVFVLSALITIGKFSLLQSIQVQGRSLDESQEEQRRIISLFSRITREKQLGGLLGELGELLGENNPFEGGSEITTLLNLLGNDPQLITTIIGLVSSNPDSLPSPRLCVQQSRNYEHLPLS